MVTETQKDLIPEAFHEIVLQRPLDADDLRFFPAQMDKAAQAAIEEPESTNDE